MNYLKTTFGDAFFDVICAIESICHCENKEEFLSEAYRLLKKNGRLIIADGFQKIQTLDQLENQNIQIFNEGLALPNISSIKMFENSMKKIAFKKIKYWDKTKAVMYSSKMFHNMCGKNYPFTKIIKKLYLTSKILTKNNNAGIV